MPEILWKAYIDFEIEQEETDRGRDLYKRLLHRTQHVKVWLSYAQFELQVSIYKILYVNKKTKYGTNR